MAIGRQTEEPRLDAFLLCGDASAGRWLGPVLRDEQSVQSYGRLLLSSGARPPAAMPARSPQICACMNVDEASISSALAICEGSADERLAQLVFSGLRHALRLLYSQNQTTGTCDACTAVGSPAGCLQISMSGNAYERPAMTNSHATSLPPVGRCYLVGAGPGDPELLTLKALRLIQSATLLLADDLVSADIVKLPAPPASSMWASAAGARHLQEFIEKLMIMAARQGELVVRLKAAIPSSLAVAAKRSSICARA
jgi:hypothetical protein